MAESQKNYSVRNDSSISTNFNELNLENGVLIDIPKDIIFPSELNRFLKDKVQYLAHENGMLKKSLSESQMKLQESDCKINDLATKLEKDGQAGDSVQNVVRSKIVELSKKLREKNAEFESCKRKCAKLEQELIGYKHGEEGSEEKAVVEEELKVLQDKVAGLQGKLFEEKSGALKLRNELKQARKILQEETGEPVDDLTQLRSTWKGRAQLIADLQQKNSELKERVKSMHDRESFKNEKKTLMEKKIEKYAKENADAKNENCELKRRIDVLKSRLKTLEIDNVSWKSKFCALSEAAARDAETIEVLNAQNVNSMKNQNDVAKKKDLKIEKLQKELATARQECKMEQCKVGNLERTIQELQSEFDKIKLKEFKIEDERINEQFKAERMKLAELITITNKRVNAERDARYKAETLCRQERHKSALLETKLGRLQLEELNGYASYKSASHETSECKLKLAEEQIKALKSRLELQKREKEIDNQEFYNIIKNCSCCGKQN